MGGERTVEDVSRPASFQAGNPPSSSRTSLKPNARYIHQQRAALIEYCVTEVLPWRQAYGHAPEHALCVIDYNCVITCNPNIPHKLLQGPCM